MIAYPLARGLASNLMRPVASGDGGAPAGSVPVLDWNPASGSFASAVGPTPAFSRASGATYVNAAGLVQMAAINVPRITYDPVTHECLGYLAEEQRTNGLLGSSDLTAAAWNKRGSVVVSNAVTAPDGSMTADSLTVGAIDVKDLYQFLPTFTAANDPYAFSFWIKKITATGIVKFTNPSTPKGDWRLNLALLGSEWTRVTSSHPAVTVVSPYATDVTGAGIHIVSFDGSDKSFYVWGLQAELGAFPTSYIPTTTAAATRSADRCQIGGADFTGFYNPVEGTAVVKSITNSSTHAMPLEFSNGTADHEIQINSRYFLVAINTVGVSQTIFDAIEPLPGTKTTLALAWKFNDIAFSTGSQLLTDNTATLPTVSFLDFGTGVNGSWPLNGTIARIQYFNKRLPNAELITLTTP